MRVAPLAGAWIEMLTIVSGTLRHHVAPLAGAWIEIELEKVADAFNAVAPLAGAWIEIVRYMKRCDYAMSLPSRERGLKYYDVNSLYPSVMSLPSRERGLKSL